MGAAMGAGDEPMGAGDEHGCWGTEARDSSRLAAQLALQLHCSKSKALVSIYQRLNLTLVHLRSQGLTFTCLHPDPRGLKTLV